MNSSLEIRPYELGDDEQILTLFRQSYGRELSEQFWTWRFRNNPAGPGIIYLGWDGNVVASHYATTQLVLRINGQDWPTGLSGTTMTHPDYRGRGLFEELARRTYLHMTELGMAMVWGFPNAMIHRSRVQHLKWVDIYEVPTLRLALTPHLALPGANNNIVELPKFDERFDSLWDRVKDEYRVIAKRDHQHLQWRYFQNPQERYRVIADIEGSKVLGYAVFKRYKAESQVVDILAENVSIGEQLILRIVQLAAAESATTIGLWLNVTHPLHHALEKMGFRNGEPVTYLGALGLQPGMEDAGIYDFRNWYWTMGDSDVF